MPGNESSRKNPDLRVKDIADREGCKGRYIARHLKLAGLSPTIIRAILTGTQAPELTADRLLKMTGLPLVWADQEALLG